MRTPAPQMRKPPPQTSGAPETSLASGQHNIVIAPAAPAGVPLRPSGARACICLSRSGLTPALICRPSISSVASPPAGALVRRVSGVSGVVVDDVKPALWAQHRLHEALGKVGRSHAADAGHRLPAGRDDLSDRLLGRRPVQIIDHAVGAFRRARRNRSRGTE